MPDEFSLTDAHPKCINSRFNTVAILARHIQGQGYQDCDLPFCYLVHVEWETNKLQADKMRAVFNYWTDVQRFLACSIDQADHWTDQLAERLGEEGNPIPWRNHEFYGEFVRMFLDPDHAVDKPLTKERMATLRGAIEHCCRDANAEPTENHNEQQTND